MSSVIRRYTRETRAYWRETSSLRGFVDLMRIRLSQSKIGPLVCPHPITREISLKSFGGPLWLRSHSSDISIVSEQITHPRSACHPCYPSILPRTQDTVDVVVDLGANTGIVSRWLAHHHPHARILCVEPAEENVEVLARNLVALGDRAILVPHCIGGVSRTVKLATTNGSWAYAMSDDGPGEDSDVITLGGLLDEHGIDRVALLKSNIEGAEWEVLEHSSDWIDKVDNLVIELHYEPEPLQRFNRLVGEGWQVLYREANPVVADCELFTMVRA